MLNLARRAGKPEPPNMACSWPEGRARYILRDELSILVVYSNSSVSLRVLWRVPSIEQKLKSAYSSSHACSLARNREFRQASHRFFILKRSVPVVFSNSRVYSRVFLGNSRSAVLQTNFMRHCENRVTVFVVSSTTRLYSRVSLLY